MKKGFTLIEMLVVIGIIALLSGAIVVGMNKVTKTAQRQQAQETVSNAAVALTHILQKNMRWPTKLANQPQGRLDENISKIFVAAGDADSDGNVKPLMGLAFKKSGTDNSSITLLGKDRFGVVTPWATKVLKRKEASKGTAVSIGGKVQDHVLYYAIDEDGDGITEATIGGKTVRVRASALCWSIGPDGGDKKDHTPHAYGTVIASQNNIYSWNAAQEEK